MLLHLSSVSCCFSNILDVPDVLLVVEFCRRNTSTQSRNCVVLQRQLGNDCRCRVRLAASFDGICRFAAPSQSPSLFDVATWWRRRFQVTPSFCYMCVLEWFFRFISWFLTCTASNSSSSTYSFTVAV